MAKKKLRYQVWFLFSMMVVPAVIVTALLVWLAGEAMPCQFGSKEQRIEAACPVRSRP